MAAYDAARGEVGNPAYGRGAGARRAGHQAGHRSGVLREQAREKAYSADMEKKLQLARELRPDRRHRPAWKMKSLACWSPS